MLTELKTPELKSAALANGLDLVIAFGSAVRGSAGVHSDLDVAVMPGGRGRGVPRIHLLHELCDALGRSDVDLVWLPHASWLLWSRIAREGAVLHEVRPGEFKRFQRDCHWRQVDSQDWRRRKQAYLDRFLRRQLRMDRDLILEKSLQMSQYLGELEIVLGYPESEFQTNPLLHRTAERDLELLVECAARINTEIGEDRGIPPSDYYSSFFALRGRLDSETLQTLADTARLRNLIVHQYEKVDLDEVYSTVRETLPLWRVYLQAVATCCDTGA